MQRALAMIGAAFLLAAALVRPSPHSHARAGTRVARERPSIEASVPAAAPSAAVAWHQPVREPLNPEPIEEDGELLCLNRKLETMLAPIGLEECKLEDVVAFLRDFTGLNIIVDAGIRDTVDLERVFPFHANGLLRDVLAYLCWINGLQFMVTEEGVVLITLPPDRTPPRDAPRDLVSRVLDEAIR